MSIAYKLNGVDISDYINGSNNIPFVSRNRDWTITSNGFGCTISFSSSTVPSLGGILEVYNDTDSEFLGIIEDVELDYDTENYNIQVAHYFKNGLKDTTVKASVLIPYFIDTGIDHSATIDSTLDTVSYIQGPFDPPIANGDYVYFKADTMPEPLDPNKQYKIIDLNTSGGTAFFSIAELGGSIAIDIETNGSNVEFGISDKEKYIQYDKDGYPSIQLAWLIECLCLAIGFTPDLTNFSGLTLFVDSVNDLLGSSVDADFTFYNTRLDTNMLFCVNQNIAVNPDQLEKDEDTLESQISCFNLLSELCSQWGMYFKYNGSIGNRTFKAFLIPRQTTGIYKGYMLLSSNISYTPSDVYSKKSKAINQISDFCKTEINYPPDFTNKAATYDQRAVFASSTKSNLTVFDKVLFSFKYLMTTGSDNSINLTLSEDIDKLRSIAYFQSGDSEALGLNLVTKAEDVSMLSNIHYYPSNSVLGGNSWDIAPGYNPQLQNDLDQIYKNKVARYAAKWTIETIETDVLDSESRVKQNEIAPEGNGTSVIIQEIPSI